MRVHGVKSPKKYTRFGGDQNLESFGCNGLSFAIALPDENTNGGETYATRGQKKGSTLFIRSEEQFDNGFAESTWG
jgi:hypothetical protein